MAPSHSASLAASAPDGGAAGHSPATGRDVARAALPWAVAGWTIGVLLLGIWRVGGWVAAQRLRVLGVNPAGAALAAKADELARRLGLRGAVTIFESFLVQTPVVIGWLRPVVLIPAAVLTGLTPAQLEAILVHELAHIRRQDYLVNAMQTLAETLLFYHPMVWWMSARVRLEREQCCDEVAVATCGNPRGYAASLAALEEIRMGGGFALAAGGAGGRQLLARIRRVLGLAPTTSGRGFGAIAAAAAVALMLAAFAAFAQVSTRPGDRPADHAATAPGAPATNPHPPRVLLVTTGNYFLNKVADTEMKAAKPLVQTPAQYEAGSEERYDLAIFDHYQPKKPPAVPALYFAAVPGESDLKIATDADGHPISLPDQEVVDWQKDHPLLSGIEMNKLFVAHALKLHVPGGWEILARGPDGPLIIAQDAPGLRQIVVAFDTQESNWPMNMGFPLFCRRSFEWLMRSDGERGVQVKSRGYSAEEIARIDPRMSDRLTRRNELAIALVDLQTRFGPRHPQVIQQRRLLDFLDQDIAKAVERFNETTPATEPTGQAAVVAALGERVKALEDLLRQVQAQHKVGVALMSDVYEATRDAAEARAELAAAKGDKPLEAKELNAAIDAARKLVDIQKKRFEQGLLTGVDVLRSQKELTDLQVRLARLSPDDGQP